ncbi:MAG: response regulator [Desulfomonilaceae bacterium]|jgi:DNA-binding response OmpR family regulator|nr:response regulator [Syntrophaceae bacterium]
MKEFKVLMVDDEEDFVRTLDERIQMRNLDTSVALSGEEAMKKLEEDPPDVLLVDLKMPGMDGMEVLRRAREAYPGVQVVMLTGHGSEADEVEARRLGVFEYLRKPVALDQLMRTLKAAYKKKIEETMVAASFAEEGDFDSAREIMKRGDKNK